MVYKKKATTKRTYKKRTYKKRTYDRPLNSVNVGLGFPKQMVVKQKYFDTFTISSSSGAIGTHQFILNGLYDPDFSGAGHQPMYFDQYMSIYNHYTVIGAIVRATFVPIEGNTIPMNVALWQNDDTTITPTSIDNMQEQSKARAYILGSGGDTSRTLTLKWSAKKTFGPPMANTLLRGNLSNNPTEQSVAVLAVQSSNLSTTGSCSVQVSIEFVTVYSELRDIQGS